MGGQKRGVIVATVKGDMRETDAGAACSVEYPNACDLFSSALTNYEKDPRSRKLTDL